MIDTELSITKVRAVAGQRHVVGPLMLKEGGSSDPESVQESAGS